VAGVAGLVGAGSMLVLNADRIAASDEENKESVTARGVPAAVELKINGKKVNVDVPGQRSLLLTLRENLGLTGTKKGCNLGQCGACTVLMDGEPVYSCMTLAREAAGHEITTIEGLEKNGRLHPVQAGFIEKMGSQCGMCSPGMIMCGAALLAKNPSPSAEEVRFAISGVLCRCGNYPHEVEGIMAASAGGASLDTTFIPKDAGLEAPFLGAKESKPASIVAAASDDAQLAHLGKRGPALDGYTKATGRAMYAGDFGFHPNDPFQKPLFAKIVRSPTAHAMALSIDDSRARELKGYRGMVTWEDVPPLKNRRLCFNQHARFAGDAVAAIAADDEYTANEALKRIRVKWKQLPLYMDPEEKLRTNNTGIDAGGPVAGWGGPQPADKPLELGPGFNRGDVKQGMTSADKVVTGKYTVGRQCHVPIEAHCCTAIWKDDHLTVWDSQQSVFNAQFQIAKAMNIKPQNVRVVCENVGGGFGGKCTDTVSKSMYQVAAALLAKKTGRPVRLEFTHDELTYAVDCGDTATIEIKTGVTKDGRLTALECRAVMPVGGYDSAGAAQLQSALETIDDSLDLDAIHFTAYPVFTTGPVSGEFRGFGGPQGAFAFAVHLDKIAEELGLDPLDILRKNFKKPGQVWVQQGVEAKAGNAATDKCLDLGAKAIGWDKRRPPSEKTTRIRRGLGVYSSQQHSGREPSDGLVWLDPNGTIHVPIGTGNMGQSAHTGIAAIVAQVLDTPIEKLDVSWGDTDDNAWVFVTDASRSCYCDGKAVYNAAQDLIHQMMEQVATTHNVPGDQLRIHNGGIEGPGGLRLDFRTIAQSAKPRANFEPYFDPKTDFHPNLDIETGSVTKNPSMAVEWQTKNLAQQLLTKGGIVGLGRFIFNPSASAWGATFADVEVDMVTGKVRVLKLVVVSDIGRVLYLTGAEGQVYGGSIMSLGYGLTEDLIQDPNSGIPMNPEYLGLMPTSSLDYPEMVPIFVESALDPSGAFGAKGFGENTMFGTAPAVANAVFNASGVRVEEIPITWEKLYEQIRQANRLMM
jgi:CO/xanthine dehydrogenase Mo-binding subunit/aerobic-type carbon monoxide dehydrogenase small subunit (CoxS/CutS family)